MKSWTMGTVDWSISGIVPKNATRPSTVRLLQTVSDEYVRYGITINTVAPVRVPSRILVLATSWLPHRQLDQSR